MLNLLKNSIEHICCILLITLRLAIFFRLNDLAIGDLCLLVIMRNESKCLLGFRSV